MQGATQGRPQFLANQQTCIQMTGNYLLQLQFSVRLVNAIIRPFEMVVDTCSRNV